jgi:hypothetical protein
MEAEFYNRLLKKEENKSIKQLQHENSLTNLLRTLIRQKEDAAVRLKAENEHLKHLLVKQQNLLNKLNEDNMILLSNNRHHHHHREQQLCSSSTISSSQDVVVVGDNDNCCCNNHSSSFISPKQDICNSYE